MKFSFVCIYPEHNNTQHNSTSMLHSLFKYSRTQTKSQFSYKVIHNHLKYQSPVIVFLYSVQVLITFSTGVFSMPAIVRCPTTAGATPEVSLRSIAPHVIQENRPPPLTIPCSLRGGPCPIVPQLTTNYICISQPPAVITDRSPAIRRMVDLDSSFVFVPRAYQSHICDGMT